MTAAISKLEMVWNEAQAFASDLIAMEWQGVNWADVPVHVKAQFSALVSQDIPRGAFITEGHQ